MVVIPSLVNLGATTLYPVPSRIEFVNAMRAETQEANRSGSQLLGKYFSPRVFEKRALASGDLASLPQFQFAEESAGAVIRRASWPGLAMALLTILIGYAGLRRYRRYPIVG